MQLNRLFRAFRFLFQRLDARCNLGKNVGQTADVVLRLRQFPLGFGFLMAVFRNSRRVLEHTAALLALAGNHLGNFTLPDDGVTVAPDTRVHEQLVDVLQTNRLAVDEIFAVPRAVVASGNGHFVERTVQFCKIAPIVKGDRHLGISHRTATVRTAENDVFHLTSAQALGRDFTQNPTHGIGNIGFSGPVRADNDRNTLSLIGGNVHVHAAVKQQSRLVGKGLEALHFQ